VIANESGGTGDEHFSHYSSPILFYCGRPCYSHAKGTGIAESVKISGAIEPYGYCFGLHLLADTAQRDPDYEEPTMKAIRHGLLLAALVLSPLASADGHMATLEQVAAGRSAEDRARDTHRHPIQTLAFFQVEPGMTVAEGLPGGGWYTRVLAPYLGSDGTLLGVNYAQDMWPRFSFASPEWVEKRIASTAQFPGMVAEITDSGIAARGFTFADVPADLAGRVDRVLLIRALHNLNRFEQEAGTRSQALSAVYAMLADDGLVGVVQHRAPESASDTSAAGQRGYLKQSAVIAMFEEAGFQLVDSTEINANPKDQPGEKAMVWRLPPSLRGSEEGTPEREAVLAIGESDRMTLLFRKAD
jgi:predicted methyltransferase